MLQIRKKCEFIFLKLELINIIIQFQIESNQKTRKFSWFPNIQPNLQEGKKARIEKGGGILKNHNIRIPRSCHRQKSDYIEFINDHLPYQMILLSELAN